MRLPAPQRARLLRGLLLLTLLLGTVCGMQKKPRSPGAQPGNPLRKAQENMEEKEDQQPEGVAGTGSAPVTPSSLPYFLVFSNIKNKPALPKTNFSDTVPWEDEQEEDGAKKPRTHSWEQEKTYPGVKTYSPNGDRCYKWVSCNYDFFTKYLKSLQDNLPSCPCIYPARALKGVVRLFDERLNRTFSWKDVRDVEELEDGRHPSAGLCLRSLWTDNSTTLASQFCCYDAHGRLLTRGKWAGFPELISPDFSLELHFMVDHTPWEFCKGDWSIFHTILPPDNGLSCPQRPSKRKYKAQLMEL